MTGRMDAARRWLGGLGRRQRWIAGGTLIAVLALTVGGWLLLDRDATGSAVWFGGGPENSAGTVEATPGEQPESESRPDGAGVVRDQAGSAISAPPRVLPFAEQPGAPEAPIPSPTAPNEIREGNEGCDYAYGDRTVCVPWQFPDGVTARCDWLKERGYKPLKVNGRDRHGLDRNGDGTACGPGD
ncbi:hypothetical protein [Plantactinospora sonchi]|uniref:Excalibur calcium-binding domain-containing protein n=1 Tax=Plantactinospora sonchi TaxID=1544735 RepID=A0ABU7S262_9ACTN